MHFNQDFTESTSQSLISAPARTKSLHHNCDGLGVILLLICLTVPMWSQVKPSTPTTSVPSTFVGVNVNSTCSTCTNYPASGTDFGVIRLWDTSETSWPEMQASSGATLSTSKLDQVLQDAYNNSLNNQAVGMYTFGRVPNWASSDPGDTSCAYQSDGGTGQCDPPADLNADGSGTDADWRAFITALATHLNNLGSGYAPVKYFEVWNEIDRSTTLRTNNCNTASNPNNCSYNGSDAQLLRLLEDMECILTGAGTIHNYPNAYPTVPYSTACSSTGWSTSATQISGATFLSPSSHAQGTASAVANSTGVVQNFLYCSDSSLPQPDCNWGSGRNWGSAAVNIINFHMKPGNEAQTGTNTDPETEMATEYSNATAILDSTDLSKPFWNGEAGYSGNGWDPNSGDVNLSGEYVQQAAFTARYMLVQWSLSIQNFDWYAWDISNFLESGGTTTDAGIAYSTVASWMIGSTMGTSGCANVSGYTNPQGTQTLWSCTLTQGSWTGEAFWDTNSHYNCDSGTCTTYPYDVPAHSPNWHYYQTPIGSATSISSPYQIEVSNLPVIIMTNAAP